MISFKTTARTFALGCAIAAAVAAPALAQKYGVTVTADKDTDFARLKTYTWTPGRPSLDKTINAQITAAVERELSGLGLTKAASGSGDVQVTYYSVTRTDVDVNAKPDEKGVRPQRNVGTLVVAMLEPASRKELLRLRADKPVDTDPARVEGEINEAVAELFSKYPTAKK